MAAEIQRPLSRYPNTASRCFNEAAANGRGNPPIDRGQLGGPGRASMRPRRMAAEILAPAAVARMGRRWLQ